MKILTYTQLTFTSPEGHRFPVATYQLPRPTNAADEDKQRILNSPQTKMRQIQSDLYLPHPF